MFGKPACGLWEDSLLVEARYDDREDGRGPCPAAGDLWRHFKFQ
jgi:hypothetical protein